MFGMFLYEIFTGHQPYFDEERKQVAYVIVDDKETPTLSETCPSALRELLAQCWDHDRSKRPTAQKINEQMMILQALCKDPNTPVAKEFAAFEAEFKFVPGDEEYYIYEEGE
jgi:hypothetical protein